MSELTVRRLPIPMSFIVVVASVILLIIFFGAWAVSADASEGGRSLSFGFVSGNTTSATALNSADGDHSNAEDSWWGDAFLKACPFH